MALPEGTEYSRLWAQCPLLDEVTAPFLTAKFRRKLILKDKGRLKGPFMMDTAGLPGDSKEVTMPKVVSKTQAQPCPSER